MAELNDNPAPWEKRALNFIIDLLVVQFLFLLLMLIAGVVAVGLGDMKDGVLYESTDSLPYIGLYIIYYLVMESLLGRTVAKYITRTKVINRLGEKPKLSQIIIRTLVRLFFLEVVSFFKKRPIGWHDSISGTKVVEVRP